MNDKQLKAQFRHTSTEVLEEEYKFCMAQIQKLVSYGVEWVHESGQVRNLQTSAKYLHRELTRRAQAVPACK